MSDGPCLLSNSSDSLFAGSWQEGNCSEFVAQKLCAAEALISSLRPLARFSSGASVTYAAEVIEPPLLAGASKYTRITTSRSASSAHPRAAPFLVGYR
jgi:hypothetical protein